MEKATPKLRKKTFTIVEQACHEIHGFSKLYQELCDKVTLSGQTQSSSFRQVAPAHRREGDQPLPGFAGS